VTRNLAAASVATLAFVVALSLAATAMRAGVLSGDAMRLWAGASSAAGGGVPIGQIVAAYPTLPFLATTILSLILPDGAPAPALLAAALVSLVGGLWFASFLRAGMVPLAAFVTALLLALHPAILRAALGGPADVFLVLFLYTLAVALYDLRARAATPDVMAVGLALLALAFSHPVGAAVAFAAVPFLVFAVRPALIANSAVNVVAALIFPTAFAVGAFAYVSWIFPGAGWTFFAAPAASLAAWSASFADRFGNGVTGALPIDASLAILLTLAIGAPLAAFGLFAVRHRRPLVVPAMVFVATITAAAAMTVATGLFGDPTALAVAAPALAAVVVARVPGMAERRALTPALAALGWLGGAAGLALVDSATVAQLRVALSGGDHERNEALAAGAATSERQGLLVDSENAPAFVIGRGDGRGLFGPSQEEFALALLFRHLATPFVAVPDPLSETGATDRLDRAFPDLFRRGAPSYHLIYHNSTWKLFERDFGNAP
jgi:hypothetical protein